VAGLILWVVDSIYQLDQEMSLEAFQAVNSVKFSLVATSGGSNQLMFQRQTPSPSSGF
jgi:hypothetical protein